MRACPNGSSARLIAQVLAEILAKGLITDSRSIAPAPVANTRERAPLGTPEFFAYSERGATGMVAFKENGVRTKISSDPILVLEPLVCRFVLLDDLRLDTTAGVHLKTLLSSPYPNSFSVRTPWEDLLRAAGRPRPPDTLRPAFLKRSKGRRSSLAWPSFRSIS